MPHRADPALAPALAELLAVPEGNRVSELERLRTPPVKSTGTAMVRAMERVGEISAFADLVPAMWRRAVFSNAKLPQGAVDRDAYVVCVLEQLHRAPNRRDVFAAPSNRWADPRARLLDGPRWEAMRADVLAGLSLSEDAGEHLAQLTRGLDAAWRQMADRLEEAGTDAKVEIVVPEGGGRARSARWSCAAPRATPSTPSTPWTPC
ncbi:hypothetical protein ABZU32_36220 [Sphaerisporangium sp. NPDC005288]|uniref:hypothetical protein n=1 Tax=Sphaerisporangium sp. NPDC005288 TaxID=3155114 RepID=UPI0033BD9FAD